MSDEIVRVPGVVKREPFTPAEQQDISNRAARQHYWSKRQREADEAEAQAKLATLPSERRAEILHRYLEGASDDEIIDEVLGRGGK